MRVTKVLREDATAEDVIASIVDFVPAEKVQVEVDELSIATIDFVDLDDIERLLALGRIQNLVRPVRQLQVSDEDSFTANFQGA